MKATLPTSWDNILDDNDLHSTKLQRAKLHKQLGLLANPEVRTEVLRDLERDEADFLIRLFGKHIPKREALVETRKQ